jgi:hypothetical protein
MEVLSTQRMFLAFDPIGIGEAPSYIVLGIILGFALLFAGFLFWDWWDTRRLTSYDDYSESGGTSDGILLLHFLREADLAAIADQTGILPNPAWIERGQSSESSTEVQAAPSGMGAKAGHKHGEDARQHVEMPRDHASLVRKLIEKLRANENLNLRLGLAPHVPETSHPVLVNPDATRAFLDQHLNDQYYEGWDGDWDRLISVIVRGLQQKAQEELIEQKRHEFRSITRDRLVLVDGEWDVRMSGQDGDVVLMLSKLDAPFRSPDSPSDKQGLAMPQGISLFARLDADALTDRGRRDLRGGEVRRLGVFATVQNFNEGLGQLQIAPIAVFSRTGGAPFRPDGYYAYGYPC